MAKRKGNTSREQPKKRPKYKHVKDAYIEQPHLHERYWEVKHKRSPLLALPAELRNMIYEYALYTPYRIVVTRDLKAPGLVSANRQIRNETFRFYYILNSFRCEIWNCDAALLSKWYCLLMRIQVYAEYDLALYGKADWNNLVTWCRKVYQGRSTGPNIHRLATARPSRLHRVVTAAIKMTFRFPPYRWESCEWSLLAWREVAGYIDPEWLKG